MPSEKGFLDHSDLVQNLMDLGMTIHDPKSAERQLRRLGYHRTASYRYLFRQLNPQPSTPHQRKLREYRRDSFMLGSQFEDSIDLADFDSRLREVCLHGLMDYEIRLRTAVAHELARHNPKAHLDPQFLDQQACNRPAGGKQSRNNRTAFDVWQDTCQKTTRDNRHEDFVAHHREKYGTPLPVWAIVELLSFGNLAHLVNMLKSTDRRRVASKFGIKNDYHFTSLNWAMVGLRNTCAHGSRLFNARLKHRVEVSPTTGVSNLIGHLFQPTRPSRELQSTSYRAFAILAYFLRSHEVGSDWHRQLVTCINSLPLIELTGASAPLVTPESNMGFPRGWESLDLWQ